MKVQHSQASACLEAACTPGPAQSQVAAWQAGVARQGVAFLGHPCHPRALVPLGTPPVGAHLGVGAPRALRCCLHGGRVKSRAGRHAACCCDSMMHHWRCAAAHTARWLECSSCRGVECTACIGILVDAANACPPGGSQAHLVATAHLGLALLRSLHSRICSHQAGCMGPCTQMCQMLHTLWCARSCFSCRHSCCPPL